MKAALLRARNAALAVIHDPQVDRAGKGLIALVLIRLLIALGASAQAVELVRQAFGA